MNKWQENNILKHHRSRIQNAKSTFQTPTKSTRRGESASKSSKSKQKQTSVSYVSYNSSPLYSILQTFGLEQYAEPLNDLDYGYDFTKFKELKGMSKEKLLDKIGVKAKDRYKMSTLIGYLSNMISTMNSIQVKKVPKTRSPYAPPLPKSGKSHKQIKSNEYSPGYSSFHPSSSKSKSKSKSKLNLPQKKVSDYKFKKSKCNDDSVIIHKSYQQKVTVCYSSDFLVSRLTKPQFTSWNLQKVNLNVSKIKDMYLSLDSGKLSSNITNIDIQELTDCMALEIFPSIKYQPKVQQEQQEPQKQQEQLIQQQILVQKSIIKLQQSDTLIAQEIEDHPIQPITQNNLPFPSLPKLPLVLEIVQEGNESIFQSIISVKKQFIEFVMRQSMLKVNDFSPETLHDINQLQESNKANMNSWKSSQTLQQIQMQESMVDSKSLKRFQNAKLDGVLKQLPSLHMVQDYIKNLLISLRMQRQAPIFAYEYYKRLLKRCSDKNINQLSWRNVILVCLLMGSKVWDDCSLQNDTISRMLPSHNVLQLNRLQKIFVKIIDYRLTITPQQYAKSYFQLRKHCKEAKHTKDLKKLTIQEISGIQKMTSKFQFKIKNKYKNSLNKSF